MNSSSNGQFGAIIHLDEVDSSGEENRTLDLEKLRPMALSVKDGGAWYGFVITKSDTTILTPGETADVEIAFLNAEESYSTFPLRSSTLFGDGVNTKGVIFFSSHSK